VNSRRFTNGRESPARLTPEIGWNAQRFAPLGVGTRVDISPVVGRGTS
jgi:hypothetical protein